MNNIAQGPGMTYKGVDGKDIKDFIYNKLGPACQGERVSHAVLGMITYAFLVQKHDITVEQLQEAVMGTTEHMMTYLALMDMDPKDAN